MTQGVFGRDYAAAYDDLYQDKDYLAECVEIGAGGYILKDSPADQLVTAIREVHHGGSLAGFKSDLMLLPDYGVGAVLLTNSDTGGMLLRPLMRHLLEVLFDGKPEAFRKLHQKPSQNLSPILGRERGRQLNQHNLELRFERLDCAKKRVQFGGAIAQPANVGDFARKFAAETKRSWSQLDPTPDRVLRRYAVKSRIDFDCGEIAGIKFEPF